MTKRVIPAQAHSSWIAVSSSTQRRYTIKWRADQQTGRIKVRIRNTGAVATQVTQQLQKMRSRCSSRQPVTVLYTTPMTTPFSPGMTR